MPIEVEMLPLYRDPPGSARLRREQKREQRRERREKRESPTRAERLLARLATGHTRSPGVGTPDGPVELPSDHQEAALRAIR